MNPVNASRKITFAIFIFLMWNGYIRAQELNGNKFPEKDSVMTKSNGLHESLLFHQKSIFFPSMDKYPMIFSNTEKQLEFFHPDNSNNSFRYNQQFINTETPGIGVSNWFNNQFVWDAGKNIRLGFDAGLVMQNSLNDPFVPNYQYTLGIKLEYAFNEHLKAYIFGRYVSHPINKPKDYFGPLLNNNFYFLGSEYGAGFKYNYKNMLIDFQVVSGNKQRIKSMNSINSKVNISF